jgi:hypothetical protein
VKNSVSRLLVLVGTLATVVNGYAQTTMLPSVVEALANPVQSPAITQYQLEQHLLQRIPPLPTVSSAAQWTQEADRIRVHVLNDIAFHGWPQEWINEAPRFENMGVIESGNGYRIRKLRYEVVPGFMSTALLYEPTKIGGRIPAILNFIGHEPEGPAVEYEQKRCINFAKLGMVALNIGWMEFGDMSQPGNAHDFGAHLDLVGSNALGLFYLAMKRGLDYLAALPEVDSSRIGATGLSGGGWQTVLLSAMDPRIAVSVEVAGLGSRESNLTNPKDTYEIEEDAPDLMHGFDYPELVAMRAARPTLLIHNAVDSCCFRAPLVKPYLYDNVKPFFALYGAPQNLAWYENFDPGVHNYQADNRVQAYRFFTAQFHLPVADHEIFSDAEIRTQRELSIEVPADNETILGLAKKLALHNQRQSTPGREDERHDSAQATRERLKSVIRYQKADVLSALRMANSRGMDFQTLSYRFDLSSGLSATGVWFKEDHAPESAPVTIVLNDDGYKAAGQQVFESLRRGKRVLALDLLFTGATRPDVPDPSDWEVLVDSSGERSLGLEAAQLLSVIQWLRSAEGVHEIDLETKGIRTQVVALVTAALEPGAIRTVHTDGGMQSLSYLLEKPVPFRAAADLFCLDLYRDFDIDMLSSLASPAKINQTGLLR